MAEGKELQQSLQLASALNRCSAENGSNTPDFILADFLGACLAAFDAAVKRRAEWYGQTLEDPGVCAPEEPLSGGEMRELALFCHDRPSSDELNLILWLDRHGNLNRAAIRRAMRDGE
jgi:hypothetical protein